MSQRNGYERKKIQGLSRIFPTLKRQTISISVNNKASMLQVLRNLVEPNLWNQASPLGLYQSPCCSQDTPPKAGTRADRDIMSSYNADDKGSS